ncbi:NADH-quinone oxidoreductase subunit K [Salinimonas chungwhensis]|uniref:NADH-quinone oxidoreductase subunit K n=1 Tax=Salinimonas chungwhensis TaxID=265425 RepID=UPI000369281C|nr:NADH-quinone oxidoreductase subunit K [Salinimonas chungwhensis]
MSEQALYTALGIALFWLGLYRAVTVTSMLIKVVAYNIAGAGTFMVLIATAYSPTEPADPVPHAIVLTGIVVSLAATALAVLLALRCQREDNGGGRHNND